MANSSNVKPEEAPNMNVTQARALDIRNLFECNVLPELQHDLTLKEYQEAIAHTFGDHPLSEAIYDAFMGQLVAQWRVVSACFDITFCDEDPTPALYSVDGKISSKKMFEVVEESEALHVYRSDGSHDYLDKMSIEHKGQMETMNTIFRAVHDVLGHVATQAGFGWKGETTAYLSHAMTFTDTALPALFSETVAQQCYYAVYGDFAPQTTSWHPSEAFNPPMK